MEIQKQYIVQFDVTDSGRPWMVFPKVFGDNRGSFSEVLVDRDGLIDVKQINRSISSQLVFRGFHAQRGASCQSKLVEALTLPIYDIIIDARPNSTSFGLCDAFLLDPEKQNKLFAPHGFLHAFFVPKSENAAKQAIFMYYCDNVYDKSSEICISPTSVFPMLVKYAEKCASTALHTVAEAIKQNENIVLSEKDKIGFDYANFMQNVLDEYKMSGKLWYCA